MPQRATPFLWLTLILLLSGLLGARLLNYDLLFTDEYLSMRNAGLVEGSLSYTQVIDRTIREDLGGMGVVYHLELKTWGDLIGGTPYGARVFSLLWGMLALAFTYRLATDLFNTRIGLYSTVLLAFSAFFVDYLHEARAYTQFTALTLSTLWIYWRIYRQPKPAIGWYLALIFSISWLIYTHYIALSIGAVLGVFHLFQFSRQHKWWFTVLAMALGGLTYLPWVANTLEVIGRGTRETTRHATSMNAGQFVPLFFSTFANANVALLLLLGWFLLASWQWADWRKMVRSGTFFVVCWLIVAGLLVVVVNARIPFMVHLRYVIFLFPAMAILCALGIQQLSKHNIRPLIPLSIWAIVGVFQTFNPHFIGDLFGQIYRAPAEGMYLSREVIRERGNVDSDIWLIHIAQPSFNMPVGEVSRPGFEEFQQFPNAYLFAGLPIKRAEQMEMMNLSQSEDDNSYLQDSLPVFEGADFVWTSRIPELQITNRSLVVNYILQTQYAHCETIFDRSDVITNLYTRIPTEEIPTVSVSTPEGQTLGIYVLRIQNNADQHRVILGWDTRNFPIGLYSYSVRLFDENGVMLQNVDHGIPTTQPFACTSDVLGVPVGEYRIGVIVYNWQTGERLNPEPLILNP
jgi:hypothetical protein